MRRYNQISGQNIQRIEFLSDGVFAIALTLLVLDIHVPIRENISSEKGLVIAFYTLTPKMLTYFLSFMTLGIFWTAQCTLFHLIEKSDRNFNWLNLSFLFFVTVTPFTTAFLSEYIAFKFAIGIYWLNLFLIGMMLNLMFRYADKHDYFKSNIIEKAAIKNAMIRRGIIAQSLYALGALSCFINTYLSIAVLTMIQLFFVLALFSKSQSRVELIKNSVLEQATDDE